MRSFLELLTFTRALNVSYIPFAGLDGIFLDGFFRNVDRMDILILMTFDEWRLVLWREQDGCGFARMNS